MLVLNSFLFSPGPKHREWCHPWWVGLSMLIKIMPLRNSPRSFSLVILDCVKLTSKTNYHNHRASQRWQLANCIQINKEQKGWTGAFHAQREICRPVTGSLASMIHLFWVLPTPAQMSLGTTESWWQQEWTWLFVSRSAWTQTSTEGEKDRRDKGKKQTSRISEMSGWPPDWRGEPRSWMTDSHSLLQIETYICWLKIRHKTDIYYVNPPCFPIIGLSE